MKVHAGPLVAVKESGSDDLEAFFAALPAVARKELADLAARDVEFGEDVARERLASTPPDAGHGGVP